MTKTAKRGSLPYDAELAELERRRLEDLANNPTHQSGVSQAQRQFLDNTRRELQTALADLKRTALKRDATVPARQSYDRSHMRVRKVAERLAEITGESQSIPKWHPPIGQLEETETVSPPEFDRGTYREGGKKAGALPVPRPGSAGDWTETK